MSTAVRKPRKKKPPTKKQLHAALLRRHRARYDELLKLQGGRCGICKRLPLDHRRFDMDHDHDGMFVRGLLCRQCNRNLGARMGKEPDAAWHEAAAKYLRRGNHMNLI